MRTSSSLARTVARALKQAMRERDLDVAELLLQALEHLETECRCGGLLEEALLAIGEQSQHTPRPKRPEH